MSLSPTDESTATPSKTPPRSPAPDGDEQTVDAASTLALSTWKNMSIYNRTLGSPSALIKCHNEKLEAASEDSIRKSVGEESPLTHDLGFSGVIQLTNEESSGIPSDKEDAEKGAAWRRRKVKSMVALDAISYKMGVGVARYLLLTNQALGVRLEIAAMETFELDSDINEHFAVSADSEEPIPVDVPEAVIQTLALICRTNPEAFVPWVYEGWYRNLPAPLCAGWHQ
ncbi:hypothetical protein D9611_008395 [Ephemerocybe angulata]|uniref:Uncharacterized protein n=1 Tax=Ephemerocybe angulata TaxID=980116 RepID=A0A8H5F4Y1_9AGAR|nr:hypothetical protein D9611_008395 [Tulosesus angulatus]